MNSSTLRKIKLAVTSILLTFSSLLLLPANTLAISANVSMSASASTVIQANNTVITISVNTNGAVTDGGEVRVLFDQSKLQFVSVDYAGSPLNSDSPNYAAGAGFIVISRYTNAPPGPTGSFTLAKLTFKALASSGTSPVSIDQAASYFSDHATSTDAPPTSVSGTTITFQAPPAAPVTPTDTTTTQNNTTPSNAPSTGSTKPAPSKATNTTPKASTTTAAPEPVAETPSPTTPTSPEGEPVPAVPVQKETSPRLLIIGAASTLALIAVAVTAVTITRKRSMNSFVLPNSLTTNVPQDPMTVDNPINKIPSVETKAPGEVIQPQSGDTNPPRLN